MEVRLVLDWRVNVHDEIDAIHMHPAGSDVGGDQHFRIAADKLCQVSVASVLRQVALEFDRRYAAGCQLFRELFGLMFHASEKYPTGVS